VATNQNQGKPTAKPTPKPQARPKTTPRPKPAPVKKPVLKKTAPKPNKNQSFGGTLKSFLPGGQPANFAAAGQNLKNIGKELTGVADIERGMESLQAGNKGEAAFNFGMAALGYIPIIGKPAATAARVLKGAAKATPVVNKVAPVISRVPGASRVGDIVSSGAQKVSTKVDKYGQGIYKPVVKPGKVKLTPGQVAGRAASDLTTSRIALAANALPFGYGLAQSLMTPASATPATPNIFDAAQRSWEQTQLAAALMGTNVPKTGGGTPGAGGGAGTGPGTGGGGGTTPPPGVEPEIPVLEAPDMDGGMGIDVGGGEEGYGVDEIDTGSELEFGTGEDMGRLPASPGTPGGVAKAAAGYSADRANIAADFRSRDAALRELFSQGLMGVKGTAADIMGGRSAAILGQGTTGVRRDYQTGLAQAAQERIARENALARTYGSEVAAGYDQAAQEVLDLAQRRSEAAAKIRSMG
jgi:hypothetical protein